MEHLPCDLVWISPLRFLRKRTNVWFHEPHKINIPHLDGIEARARIENDFGIVG
jgi:hypothetical protein